MKSNKKAKIAISILIALIILAVAGTLVYNNYKEKQKEEAISNFATQMEEETNLFQNADRDEKLELLKRLIDEYGEYTESNDTVIDEINQMYQSKIKEMRDWFNKDYAAIIEKNDFEDNEESLKTLKAKKKNLEGLVETIQNEKNIVLDEGSAEEFITDIQDIITQYSDRIKKIKKEQEEKKAEERAKREAEQKENANSGNGNNNNPNTNTSNSNSGDSGNNGRPAGVPSDAISWYVDEDGFYSWRDSKGYFHDSFGNVLTPDEWEAAINGEQV